MSPVVVSETLVVIGGCSFRQKLTEQTNRRIKVATSARKSVGHVRFPPFAVRNVDLATVFAVALAVARPPRQAFQSGSHSPVRLRREADRRPNECSEMSLM